MSWPEDMSGGEPWVEHPPVEVPRPHVDLPTGATFRPYDPDAPTPPPTPGNPAWWGGAAALTTLAGVCGVIVVVMAATVAHTMIDPPEDSGGILIVMGFVIGVPALGIGLLSAIFAWYSFKRAKNAAF